MKKLSFFLLLASISIFIACKGEIGPAGPAGQDGADGLDGQNGNANVKNLVTTVSATNWVLFNSGLSYIDLSVPIVTTDIAATGLVMVYFQEAGNEWYALPFSRGSQSYFFWAKPGQVRIHTQNDSTSPTKFAGNVRIVAVSSEGLVRNPNVNWTDYASVKKAFKLSD